MPVAKRKPAAGPAPAPRVERRRIDLGYRPRAFQRALHRSKRRFNTWVLHRRAGKTVCSVLELIHEATDHRNPLTDRRYAYIAPFRKQARAIAWDYVKKYTAAIDGMKYNEGELEATFPNGSRLRLLGADNPDALRGLYLDGCVMDEVAQMRAETWHEVVRPTLADRHGWVIFIGTPKGENLFHELYLQAQENASGEWSCTLLTVYETDALSSGEIEALKAETPEAAFRQEFLCDFSASSENVLITIDMVVEAQRRVATSEHDLRGLPKIMGIDVARFGGDRCALARRHGPLLHPIKSWVDIDNMTFAGLIAQEITEWQPDAVFIDGGRGEGVIDRLRQLGHFVIEVNFGGKPANKRYANKRTEIWDLMAIWLQEGGILPPDPDLRADLVVPTYTFDPSNRMKLDPKRDPRDASKRGGTAGRSTDLADALACTFAHPVAASASSVVGRRASSNTPARAFDPWQW